MQDRRYEALHFLNPATKCWRLCVGRCISRNSQEPNAARQRIYQVGFLTFLRLCIIVRADFKDNQWAMGSAYIV
jgi:hypothetical protein